MPRIVRLILSLSLLTGVAQAETTAPSIVVAHDGIAITTIDIARYLEFNLAPEARISGVKRERAIKQLVENLYVLRRAELAEKDLQILTPERLDWVAAYERTRYAAIRYFDAKREEQVDTIDWEQQARELYAANPEEFSTGDQVDVSHILIKKEGKTFDEWIAAITNMRLALQSGEAFETVAREYSEDASAQGGGVLGLRSKGQLVKPFEDAAFALANPGDLSEPIMTQFGVHIIKLNKRQGPSIRPFSSVQKILEARAKENARSGLKSRATLPFKQEIGPAIREIDEEAVRTEILPLINTNW